LIFFGIHGWRSEPGIFDFFGIHGWQSEPGIFDLFGIHGWQSEPGIFDFFGIHGWQSEPGIFDFSLSTVGSQNRVYLIFVTVCELNMLKTSVQVLSPDDWGLQMRNM
jgi:hypothetical protein